MSTVSRALPDVLEGILSGATSQRAVGFLLHMPPGFAMASGIERALARVYGGLAHPDLRLLEPTGASMIISVDAVRDLLPFLSAAPSGKGFKTLLISAADRMNDAAANALLKSLEEPTASTRIILVTDAPGSLPATVLSRCLRLPIAAAEAEARAELLERLALREGEAAADPAPAELDAALAVAGGNPRDAAVVIVSGLADWAGRVASWLSSPRGQTGPETAPPMPPMAGKTAAPVESCGAVLHALLHGALLDNAGLDSGLPVRLKGWSDERLLSGAARLAAALVDIRRPGLDARLRLHRILADLASAS